MGINTQAKKELMKELEFIFCIIVSLIVATLGSYITFAIYFEGINFMQWPYPTSGNLWIAFFLFDALFIVSYQLIYRPDKKNA